MCIQLRYLPFTYDLSLFNTSLFFSISDGASILNSVTIDDPTAKHKLKMNINLYMSVLTRVIREHR